MTWKSPVRQSAPFTAWTVLNRCPLFLFTCFSKHTTFIMFDETPQPQEVYHGVACEPEAAPAAQRERQACAAGAGHCEDVDLDEGQRQGSQPPGRRRTS